jgi:hypothetical protein
MKIIRIEVHSETRFNDEHESYRNHCPGITVTADVPEGLDIALCCKNLQHIADLAVDAHRQRILARRNEENQEAEKARKIKRCFDTITGSRERISEAIDALKTDLLADWQRQNIEDDIRDNRASIAASKKALVELTGSPIPIEDDPIDFEEKAPESAPAQDGKEVSES